MNEQQIRLYKGSKRHFIFSIVSLLFLIALVVLVLVILNNVVWPILSGWKNTSRGVDVIQSFINNPKEIHNFLNSLYLENLSQDNIDQIQSAINKYNDILNGSNNLNVKQLTEAMNEITKQIQLTGLELSLKGKEFINILNSASNSISEVDNISNDWFNLDILSIISNNEVNNDFNTLFDKYSSNIFSSKIFIYSICTFSIIIIYIICSLILFIFSILIAFKNAKNENELKLNWFLITLNIIMNLLLDGWITWFFVLMISKQKINNFELKKEQKKWQGW